jgi:hypothetical protein
MKRTRGRVRGARSGRDWGGNERIMPGPALSRKTPTTTAVANAGGNASSRSTSGEKGVESAANVANKPVAPIASDQKRADQTIWIGLNRPLGETPPHAAGSSG